MGQDGLAGSVNANIPTDVFGFSLGYFEGDFKSINGNIYNSSSAQLNPNQLFNGNIATWTSALGKPKTADASFKTHLLSTFKYDQLNRITSSEHYDFANETKGALAEYSSSYSYYANGNITNLQRTANGQALDNLNYSYDQVKKNQLLQVADAVGITEAEGDFEGTSNYTYDAIGNLISDSGEQIEKIEWTLSGKVKRVSFTNNVKPTLEFVYDPMGNRVTKISKENANPTDWKYTYYSKDASGNTMAVYERKTKVKDSNELQIYAENNNTASIRPIEYPIYGSSRLGNYMPQADNNTEADYTLQANGTTLYSAITQNIHTNNDYLNSRNFELSDHLGNVSATVSDYKFNHAAQQLSAHVYYPFGMELPSTERCVSGGGYRYGFNGQEKVEELGAGHTTAMFWEYDPRLGRRWNIDPIVTPGESPYACFHNNPIALNDPTGLAPHGDGKTFVREVRSRIKMGVNKLFGGKRGTGARGVIKIKGGVYEARRRGPGRSGSTSSDGDVPVGDVTPDPVIPDPVIPDPVIPDPVIPDPVIPDPVIPDPVIPDPVIPDPDPCKPVTTDVNFSFNSSPAVVNPTSNGLVNGRTPQQNWNFGNRPSNMTDVNDDLDRIAGLWKPCNSFITITINTPFPQSRSTQNQWGIGNRTSTAVQVQRGLYIRNQLMMKGIPPSAFSQPGGAWLFVNWGVSNGGNGKIPTTINIR